MFPGQGSQYVGMGKDVCENYEYAKKTFHQVDGVLANVCVKLNQGYSKFSDLIFSGTEEDLKKSYNTQPALMTVSLAVFLALKEQHGTELDKLNIQGVAGHSLGEYSAICVAGGLTVAKTAEILFKRGKAMFDCVSDDTGMLAVIGSDNKTIQENIDLIKPKCLVIANSNSPAQTVVSGYLDDIEAFKTQMKDKAKRLIPLAVGGAFHGPLMQEAQDEISKEINKLVVNEVKYPVLQNYSSNFETNTKTIKNNLQRQITAPVLWVESIQKAISCGFDTFIEIGAKNVLSGLVKRISSDVRVINVETADDVKSLFEKLDLKT